MLHFSLITDHDVEDMNKDISDTGASKQSTSAIEEVKETPQMGSMVDKTVDSSENDLIAILSGELNSSYSVEAIQQQFLEAKTDDVCINLNEQQPRDAIIPDSTQLLQPKLEPMDEDATTSSGYRQKDLSNEASNHYYRRKTFRKENEQSFKVDKLLNDWTDSDSEQQQNQAIQTKMGTRVNADNDSIEPLEIDDAISLTSGTSDSEFAFVGEPYVEINPKPIKTSPK